MTFKWPDGFDRIPAEEWVSTDIEELARIVDVRHGRLSSMKIGHSVTVGFAAIGLLALCRAVPAAGQDPEAAFRTTTEVVEAARAEEWRPLLPENTVYFTLPGGQVVMELAPDFAPRHVENIKRLVRGGLFDGGAINRSQDNYVVQWGPRRSTADAGSPSFPEGFERSLPAEFEVSDAGLPFTPIPDGDVYAPEAGFVGGFPVGRDPETGIAWMAHCYGVVGVARGNAPDSGNGSGLYVVIGQAPRHLDRNLSMVGRIVSGMEHLSSLPRGGGPLGRYQSPEEWVFLESARIGSDLPAEERRGLEILRTDSRSFADLVLAARSRHEEFFVHPSDRIGLCNVDVPIREIG